MALLEVDNLQLEGKMGYDAMWQPIEIMALQSFDIVHKGGDSVVLENIQVAIEPFSGTGYGIIAIKTGADDLTVVGKEELEGKATFSTGDRIRVEILDNMDENMPSGCLVKWTMSDVRTTGIIAKGEFVVP